MSEMPLLKIGDLEARIPIVQGGMGVGVSLSGLASAVAKEGAIGVISSAAIGMLEPDFAKDFREANARALRKEIRKAKEMKGIIGVNIMVALSDYDEHVNISVEEGADLIISGAGLPLKVPEKILQGKSEKNRTKFVPIVSSGRAAELIFRYWAKRYGLVPDAVVVEGPMAGGHLGFKREEIDNPDYALERILPDVIAVIKTYEQRYGESIPVIAAGGLFTGADIYRALQLGASGVQMATRFVGTYECDASMEFKEAYIKSKQEDIVIINSPVGMPGRAIRNKFLDDVSQGIKKPMHCPWKCLKPCDYANSPYCIALALTNAKKGYLEHGFVFAGANAYRVKEILSVKALIETLQKEYRDVSCDEFHKSS
ncbi:NAD(P)H-dependent flavin oxidoreductase [Candidatus Cryosericum odellii]|jgi:NAD(P)H-dependent flavin oxidoreductase YrpB (nitropropane dioxygenase family)|uniref:Nitronate monooxygenase n=1 Tax=Candidatus Cryosericum odellii TaxID=2290917 RepID=A0A398D1D9_9BACT|nr:nitronate monooxygenase family protein [Candidatus Cryosericum odellii]RIE08330.1 nitronate monooxygenase [Candidatus Cryosericum odellii]RIE11193.1 nitronate monooxygenase [Candidatus Cryosericum odellii]